MDEFRDFSEFEGFEDENEINNSFDMEDEGYDDSVFLVDDTTSEVGKYDFTSGNDLSYVLFGEEKSFDDSEDGYDSSMFVDSVETKSNPFMDEIKTRIKKKNLDSDSSISLNDDQILELLIDLRKTVLSLTQEVNNLNLQLIASNRRIGILEDRISKIEKSSNKDDENSRVGNENNNIDNENSENTGFTLEEILAQYSKKGK